MSKKKYNNKKHKNKYKTTNFSYNKNSKKSYVSSKDIEQIAFQVFGSTYYTSEI